MDKQTLSIGIRAGNCEDTIEDCIKQVLYFADEVVVVYDPKSTDNTETILTELQMKDDRIKILVRKWNRGSGAKHYLLKNCTKDWILFLDADEIISDNAFKIKEEYIQNPKVDAYSIQGHHFIFSFATEDATFPKHYWENRLVRNKPTLYFNKGKHHEILQGIKEKGTVIDDIRIFHLGYIKHLDKIAKQFNRDMQDLEIHTPEFLNQWKDWHMKGTYPVKKYNGDYPSILKRRFKL